MPYEDLAQAFRSGDIVYGLDGPRNTAINAILSQGFKRQVKYRTMHFGCIPGKEQTRAVVLIQNDITNSVWDAQSPNQYSSNKAIGKTLQDSQRGQQFKAFLSNHPRYNVAQNNTIGTHGMVAATQSWQRTSKAGLEFQTRLRGGKVHFVVELIIDSLDQVATKTKYGTSITSAELRWLFRHRGLTAVRDNVHFWLPDGEISHDALFGRDEWNQYNPKHTYEDDDWEKR